MFLLLKKRRLADGTVREIAWWADSVWTADGPRQVLRERVGLVPPDPAERETWLAQVRAKGRASEARVEGEAVPSAPTPTPEPVTGGTRSAEVDPATHPTVVLAHRLGALFGGTKEVQDLWMRMLELSAKKDRASTSGDNRWLISALVSLSDGLLTRAVAMPGEKVLGAFMCGAPVDRSSCSLRPMHRGKHRADWGH